MFYLNFNTLPQQNVWKHLSIKIKYRRKIKKTNDEEEKTILGYDLTVEGDEILFSLFLVNISCF